MKVYRDSLTKHVIILVVTVPGWGVDPPMNNLQRRYTSGKERKNFNSILGRDLLVPRRINLKLIANYKHQD